MTRYQVLRDLHPAQALREGRGAVWFEKDEPRFFDRERHPDAPRRGFASWTEAEIWLQERLLPPHIWRVEPFEGTP